MTKIPQCVLDTICRSGNVAPICHKCKLSTERRHYRMCDECTWIIGFHPIILTMPDSPGWWWNKNGTFVMVVVLDKLKSCLVRGNWDCDHEVPIKPDSGQWVKVEEPVL